MENAHKIIFGLHIGDAFRVRGRTYHLATYSGSGYADHFTVKVFKTTDGGTRDLKVRWDEKVEVL